MEADASSHTSAPTFCKRIEMKIQLSLLLAYANVAFWLWMMSALHAQLGTQSEIEHVPMIGFAFSLWLALRVSRAENKKLKENETE